MVSVHAKHEGIDPRRIRALHEREERRLNERTPRSAFMHKRASQSMVNGVPSSYQVRDPWPIFIDEGRGSRVRFELNGVIGTFHRPHPHKEAKAYQVRDARTFLTQAGVQP